MHCSNALFHLNCMLTPNLNVETLFQARISVDKMNEQRTSHSAESEYICNFTRSHVCKYGLITEKCIAAHTYLTDFILQYLVKKYFVKVTTC